jgi:hypothetical protein
MNRPAPKEGDLQREIRHLTLMIETNRAALRLRTLSDTHKQQLRQAIERRKARLADLQEQLAALRVHPPTDDDTRH